MALSFNINRVMATLTTNINYIQPTSFKLTIDRLNYPNLEYFCQSVNHPSMSLSPAEIPFRKLRSVPFPGGALDYGEFSANIILDEDMKAYTEMHDWMRRIVDNPLKSALDRDDSTINSVADITLSILSSSNTVIKQIRYTDAMPVVLGDIAFEATASGTEFITVAIGFRFTLFELV
tara:strand:+ start:236 stop:766 length:531 start_codon:yes stop_codon:yes gene_type:complete